jgi:hypothetical protein
MTAKRVSIAMIHDNQTYSDCGDSEIDGSRSHSAVSKGEVSPAPVGTAPNAAINDNKSSDEVLGQYYTREDLAARFYDVFCGRFDPSLYQIVEPSAGEGAFFKLLPPGSLGYDVEPKYPGIATSDFLEVTIPSDRRIAIIGNPPFGRNASMAVRFFNHAACQCDVIALILPRSFRKASIENRLDPAFHLVHEELVPDNAFIFRAKPYNVPAIFQMWRRHLQPRKLQQIETDHPDFAFTTPDLADFAIQRVGARAGRVHFDLTMSPSSHYFIKGAVEDIMTKIDFSRVVGNVAGNPSLSKSEIVAMYREWVARQSRVSQPRG